jgi:hypothetical protein
MRRRLSAGVLTLAAVAVIGGAGSASAASPDQSSCPGGYELKSLRFVLSQAAPGFKDTIKAADVNGDKLLCYKEVPAPLYDPTFSYTDNHIPNP